ncbi:MAG: hypothetical protein ACLGH4_02220 [Actinomycetes bacterium]
MNDEEGRAAARPDVVRAEERRRRRRAAVFGDVLPEATTDDHDDSGDGLARGSEEWLRAQVPPHHG